jgi:hypothetical protein
MKLFTAFFCLTVICGCCKAVEIYEKILSAALCGGKIVLSLLLLSLNMTDVTNGEHYEKDTFRIRVVCFFANGKC